MALRAECKALAARVRALVKDPYSTDQAFDNDAIQAALDEHRREARYEGLCALETVEAGGWVKYLDFVGEGGCWDTSAKLTDGRYNAVTPTASDFMAGRWVFAVQPSIPLYITGWQYDLYGAAADLCELRAVSADATELVDATEGDVKEARSQQAKHWRSQAAAYRAQAWVTMGRMVRSDVT